MDKSNTFTPTNCEFFIKLVTSQLTVCNESCCEQTDSCDHTLQKLVVTISVDEDVWAIDLQMAAARLPNNKTLCNHLLHLINLSAISLKSCRKFKHNIKFVSL